jgi:predicted amidohydrolase YtcJ
VPDRPVLLHNHDGHGAWVNTRALEAAGVGASTADPGDGRIERLADGSPQGTLHEGAMGLVERVLAPATAGDYERALLASQDLLVSLGITAWQDAAVGSRIHDAYRSLAGRGDLVVDVVGALWWDRARGMEQIDELLHRRRQPAPGYRPIAVKIMLDGVVENFTASMIDPYLDGHGGETDTMGLDQIDPETLPAIVARLDAEGFQVHFHAIGDAAVRNALDAVEAARAANGWNDTRHHIAHIQVIRPVDIPRFRRLGVVANAQPYWACFDGYQTELTIPFLGPERAAMQYPFASLLRRGATLAMGSDWSVSTPDPLLEIEVAVTRTLPDRPDDEPFFPDERIALGDALAAFTIGSAYVNHRDGESGSIEEGKAADLVVLDRNPFDPDAGRPGEARVDLTIIGGTVVYERGGAR